MRSKLLTLSLVLAGVHAHAARLPRRSAVLAAACEAGLAMPTPSKLRQDAKGVVRVDSGPVREQCLGTCQYEALVSLTQSRTGVALSSDYLNVARLKSRVAFIFEQLDHRNLRIARLSSDLPDVLDATSNDLNNALDSIRKSRGFTRAKDFEFPRDLAQSLEIWAEGHRDVRVPMNTTAERLAVKIALDIDRLAKGDPDAPQIRAEIERMIAWAERGLKERANPAKITADLLPREVKGHEFKLRHRLTDAVSDQKFSLALKQVKDTLDRGENLILITANNPYLEHGTGIDFLGNSVEVEREKIAANLGLYLSFGMHAVVIDGYELGPGNRIQWLWLKETSGDKRYDRGYRHLHVDVLRAYGFGLFTEVKEQP